MKKRIRINGISMFLAVAGVMIFPGAFLRPPESRSLGTAVEICGVLLMLIGQIIRISARGYKAENSGNGHLLIQGGPYSLVRNPMYLGIILIGLGIVLVLFKWWVVFIFFVVFLARYLILTLKEERNLLAMFPQEYPAYCKATPRIFPSLAGLFRKNINNLLPMRRAWIKSEAISVFASILAVTLVKCYSYVQR